MSTKTLAVGACKESIVLRVSSITPASPRRWGKMSPHQMLCHLADSYCAVIGEREVSLANPPLPRAILKWLVLRSPMRWPHNVPTRPELAQEGGGTPPLEFERDRRVLLNALERFCSVPDAQRTPHPILGELDRVEWLRWGYLHADHHLRQFGA